jgi:hypothetical protein
MRLVLLLVAGIGLGTALGCEITTGVCDCVDLPVPCGHHAVFAPPDAPPAEPMVMTNPGMSVSPVMPGSVPEPLKGMPSISGPVGPVPNK